MNRKKKKSLVTVFTVLIAVIVASLIIFYPKINTAFQTKVSYNDFLQQVADHEIEEVRIDEASEKITYELQDGKVYYTNYPDYESFKELLLTNDVDIKIEEKSAIDDVFPYITLAVYILIAFVLIKSVNPGGRYGIENSEKISTRFENVAGMEEIKKDLLLLAEMMKNPSYKERGARLPKGILLEGPPGNGKTLIARAFAGETGVNFIAVNASDFSSSLVGAGSSKVRRLFKQARANKPCVIFIDEIDGVGSSRSNDNSAAGREMNTIITALLNEIDGFDASDGIMVIAATNRADSLDEALIRPGRFDRQLVISFPDKATRCELLKLYSKKVKIDPSVEFDALANRTYGCSCSEIECIVNEAIILSVRNKHEGVTADDFENAIIQMIIKGSVKEHSNQSADERRRTAYHEAGHAVAGHFLTDEEVSTITIRPTTSGAGGFTITQRKEDISYYTVENIKNKIKTGYGGRAAEFILAGDDLSGVSSGAQSDIKEATKLAASCVCIQDGIDYTLFSENGEKEILKAAEEIMKEAWIETVKTLKEKWSYVEKTAELLIEKETVSKEDFLKIVSQ